MVGNEEREADDEMLRDLLRGQREAVLAVVAGLDEADWHRSVVPTGWTPAGLLAHLGGLCRLRYPGPGARRHP